MKNEMVKCPNCGKVFNANENKYVPEAATAKSNKAEQRLAALKANGVDTSNLFAAIGATGEGIIIRMANGVLTPLADNDPIFSKIVKNTIPNRTLFRRWVMSQMFRMLSTKRYLAGTYTFTEMLKAKGYDYQWKMVIDEFDAQEKLLLHKDPNFAIRNKWFNRNTLADMIEHYIKCTERYARHQRTHRCHGVRYYKFGGHNIFISDYDKLVKGWNAIITSLRSASYTPGNLARIAKKFNMERIRFSWRAGQCPEWMDAYKGCGAYYTLENLVRFHGLALVPGGDEATNMNMLQSIAYGFENGEGYKFLAYLKQTLINNHINIEEKRREWAMAKRNR